MKFSPYWTHPLTALLRFALALLVAVVCIRQPLTATVCAIWAAAVYVVAYYEGREAGQREHDLKNLDWDKSTTAQVWAWAESEFWFGWSPANLAQWLAGAVPVIILALVLTLVL